MEIAQQQGDGNPNSVGLHLQVASEQTKNGMMVQLTMHTNDGEALLGRSHGRPHGSGPNHCAECQGVASIQR